MAEISQDLGTQGNHKPEWLFEEFCDIDVERMSREFKYMYEELPWLNWVDSDDSDSEVALAWKETTLMRDGQKRYPGATRGKRARLREAPWELIKDSYFQELKQQYRLIGGTYTMMDPRSSYGWHTDKCIGFQIPVINNDDCAFVFCLDGGRSYTFFPKPGKAYLVNNMIKHTFINGGDTDRYYCLQVINPKNLLDKDYRWYTKHSGFEYRDFVLSRDYV